MIDDLDNINTTMSSIENVKKIIQEKIFNYKNIIFNFILKQTKKIFKLSIKDITKDFFNFQILPKIYELTEQFVKKDRFIDKKIGLEYFSKSNEIISNEISHNFLSSIDFYSVSKINMFFYWLEQIKNEMKNQIQENYNKI